MTLREAWFVKTQFKKIIDFIKARKVSESISPCIVQSGVDTNVMDQQERRKVCMSIEIFVFYQLSNLVNLLSQSRSQSFVQSFFPAYSICSSLLHSLIPSFSQSISPSQKNGIRTGSGNKRQIATTFKNNVSFKRQVWKIQSSCQSLNYIFCSAFFMHLFQRIQLHITRSEISRHCRSVAILACTPLYV